MTKRIFVPLKVDNAGHVTAVNYYRAMLPMKILCERDSRYELVTMTPKQVVQAAKLPDEHINGILSTFDVYWLSRLHRAEGLEAFVSSVHGYKSKLVFDTDDDLTDEFRDLGSGSDFLATVKSVDLVTVSTPFLSNRMEKHVGYKPTVLLNCLDTEWFSDISMKAERISDKLTIGFIGTTSHFDDWVVAADALRKIAKKYDNVQILTGGYTPDYLKDIPNIKQFGAVSYPWYPAMMRQFDIVCCALDSQDMFNKSKSGVKALEAMAAARPLQNGKIGGAVAVCTDMPVYRRVVNSRNNGILVNNNDWFPVLDELVRDHVLRQKVAETGHKWVRKHRNIMDHYKDWRSVISCVT